MDPFDDEAGSRPGTAFSSSPTPSRSSTRMAVLSATREEHRSIRSKVGGTDNKTFHIGSNSNVNVYNYSGPPPGNAHGVGTDVNATFRQDTFREYTSTPEGEHVLVQGTMTLRRSAVRRASLAGTHTETKGTNSTATFATVGTNTTITLDQVERLLQFKEENIERRSDLPEVHEFLNVTSDDQLKSENLQVKMELQNLKGEISKANLKLQAKENTIHELIKKQAEMARNNKKLNSKLQEEKDEKMHELENQVLTLERKIAERDGQEQACCIEARKQLEEKEGIIDRWKDEVQKRRKDVEDVCKALRHQKHECKKHSTELAKALEKVNKLEKSLDDSEKDLKKKDEHIKYLQNRIDLLRMGQKPGVQYGNKPATRRTYPPPT
ncbi:hypothetical protein Bbelb_299990 [Branchiostoma belcheri]|nr:hypothetical protein Bbelb_299990 [Branchiostoma belcheri]